MEEREEMSKETSESGTPKEGGSNPTETSGGAGGDEGPSVPSDRDQEARERAKEGPEAERDT